MNQIDYSKAKLNFSCVSKNLLRDGQYELFLFEENIIISKVTVLIISTNLFFKGID